MKKIKNCSKAFAGPLALLIIAVIVVAGIGIYVYTGSSTPYWETPNEFGMWRDELVITYADGSETTLKIVQSPQIIPGAAYYQGQEITRIGLRVTAVASGSGYDGASVDLQNFGYDVEVHKMAPSDTLIYSTSRTSNQDDTVMIGTPNTVFAESINIADIIDGYGGSAGSPFQVYFSPKGTVKYKGYPDDGSEWITATNPPPRLVNIVGVDMPSGSILVTLSSDVYTA